MLPALHALNDPTYRPITVDDVGDGVHRRLPTALRDRVDRWSLTRSKRPGAVSTERLTAKSGSANAYIRALRRKGKLNG